MLLVDTQRMAIINLYLLVLTINNIAATQGHEIINSVNFLHYDELGQWSGVRHGYESLQGPIPDGDPRDISSTLRALPHLRPDQ